MKKLIGCIVVALVTLAGSAIFAQDDGLVITDREGPSRVYGGFGIYHGEAKLDGEKVTGNPIEGMLGYCYKLPDDFFADVKGSWGGGKYDGKDKLSSSSVAVKGFAHNFDLEGRFGWMFPFGQEEEFGVVPFIGIGYSNDKATVSQRAALASLVVGEIYGKIKTHGYFIPVGVLLDWKVVPEFTVGLCAQINYTFGVKKDIKGFVIEEESSSNVATALNSSTKMKKTFGWKVEVPMTYQLTSEWDVSLVPGYEFSKLKSKTGTDESKLYGYGARLEVGYSF